MPDFSTGPRDASTTASTYEAFPKDLHIMVIGQLDLANNFNNASVSRDLHNSFGIHPYNKA